MGEPHLERTEDLRNNSFLLFVKVDGLVSLGPATVSTSTIVSTAIMVSSIVVVVSVMAILIIASIMIG